jgi:hypothetical protein
MMDLTPLLYVIRASEIPLLFLIGGLLATISMILAVPLISKVDFPVVPFLLRGPLAVRLMSRSQALEASMHTSTTVRSSATVLGFFIAISSTVLMSLTPSRKVLIISMSYMYEIAFLALHKHFT